MEVRTFSPRAKVEVGPGKRLFLKRKDLRRRGVLWEELEEEQERMVSYQQLAVHPFLPDHTFKKYFLC